MNKIYPNYQDNNAAILNDLENMQYGDQITIQDSSDFDSGLLGMLQRRDIDDLGISSEIRQLIKDKNIAGFHNGFIYKSKKSCVSYNLVCMYMENGSVIIVYPPRAWCAVAVTRLENFLRAKDLKTKPLHKVWAEGKTAKTAVFVNGKFILPTNCVTIDYLHMYERYDKGVYKGNQLFGLFPQYL